MPGGEILPIVDFRFISLPFYVCAVILDVRMCEVYLQVHALTPK